MLKKLKLTRFRGFKDLEADLRPVSVVLGPNSSGKTSLLHAIRMATEALSLSLEEGRPHLDDDGWITTAWGHIVWDHERLCPVADWDELFTNKEVAQGTAMRVELHFDEADVIQEIHAEFAYAPNYQTKMTVRLRSGLAREQVEELPKKSKYRAERLKEILSPGAPIALFVPPFYGAPREEEYRGWKVVRSMLGGGDQGRIVRNLVARLDSNELQKLNDFLSRAQVGKIVSRTAAQDADQHKHLFVSFQDTNGPLEVSSAGAGLVNLVALYASMSRISTPGSGGAKRPLLYLLDEPEAHLHPQLQGNIGLALAEVASDFGAQLVIATHSVEMINRLSLRKDAILLAVDRSKSSAVELRGEDSLLRELGAWCDLTPFASINFLAKRRVIFHEGETDEKILRRCAEIYFRNQPDKLALFRRWTFVPIKGVGNAHSPAVLNAVLNPALFPGLSTKDPAHVICVLDRDAERTPGWQDLKATKGGALVARSFTWPLHSVESLFLTPACLSAWLLLRLPAGAISDAELRGHVEQGILQANASWTLNWEATMQRMRFYLRAEKDEDGKLWQRVAPEATKKAHSDVSSHPEIFQNGKDRAKTILTHVRDAMPTNALKNEILGNIPKLVDAASIDKLGDTMRLLPEEIRTLLDAMASA